MFSQTNKFSQSISSIAKFAGGSLMLIIGLAVCGGCNRTPTEEEFGQIHYTLPKVPGAEKRFDLPAPMKVQKSKQAVADEEEENSVIPASPEAALQALEESEAAPPEAAPQEPETTPSASPPAASSEEAVTEASEGPVADLPSDPEKSSAP